jgi:hypothetical protein
MSARRILAAAVALAMVTAGSASCSSVEAPPELAPRQLADVQRLASRAIAEAGRPSAGYFGDPYTLFLQFRSVFA